MSKRRISFGSQYKFPLKLFEVVNDNVLLQWNSDGEAIIAEQKLFETHVMQYYPGFVQVKSFHNLRRLFRDYNFTHQTLKKSRPRELLMEFRHPCFKRDEPERRSLVRKRRRRQLHTVRHIDLIPLATSSPKNPRRKNWGLSQSNSPLGQDLKCKALSDPEGDTDSLSFVTEQSDSECSYKQQVSNISITIEDFRKTKQALATELHFNVHPDSSISSRKKERLNEEDLYTLLHIYAKNELSQSEFWQLVSRQAKRECECNTWEAIERFFIENVSSDLSPLHHKGFYYELDLDEL